MIDKSYADAALAVADIPDGATIMIGGFGRAGQPVDLIDALIEKGVGDLTIVNNNAGNGDTGLAALLKARRVRKIICSFPRQSDSWHFDEKYRAGEIELEIVPQGNLAERIRAAGAGIGAFYTPTGVGTQLAEGKEIREFDGRAYALELPIRADFALISAYRADRWGNLVYRKTARNVERRWVSIIFSPIPCPIFRDSPISERVLYSRPRGPVSLWPLVWVAWSLLNKK